MARIPPIIIGLDVTKIENLPKVVDEINQSINRIQDAGSEKIAQILKEIGQAVVSDSHLDNRVCKVTMEILRILASEASLPSADREPEIIKTALACIPLLQSTSLDILNYFKVHLDDLREFFGIPE